MRLVSAFVALGLTLTHSALAVQDAFRQYHSVALAGSTPIQLDDASYTDITALPRNHTAAILLTAEAPQFGCKLCMDFKPEWQLLAKSWVKGDKAGESRLLLATLDFTDGKKIFASLGLQTAPILILYQPTVGPYGQPDAEPLRYDFTIGTPSAEALHGWISRQLPPDAPKPELRRPFNWINFAIFTTLIVGVFTAATVAWPYVEPIINNRNVWAAVSLFLILLFISGHMHNHIRSNPYVAQGQKGGIMYFAPGFQNQFGMETQIVGAMYAVLAFATITLALKVPRMQDARSQQVQVLVWSAVVYFIYGLLLSVFSGKSPGYPFHLPPFGSMAF